MDTVRLVEQFHRAFRQPVQERPHLPALCEQDRVELARAWMSMRKLGETLRLVCERAVNRGPFLRLQLMQEELAEVAACYLSQDIAEMLKELTDLQYVVDGTYVTTGLQRVKRAAFQEVHDSNMTKLDEDGQPILAPSGRVEKGPNYRPADTARLVRSK